MNFRMGNIILHSKNVVITDPSTQTLTQKDKSLLKYAPEKILSHTDVCTTIKGKFSALSN